MSFVKAIIASVLIVVLGVSLGAGIFLVRELIAINSYIETHPWCPYPNQEVRFWNDRGEEKVVCLVPEDEN